MSFSDMILSSRGPGLIGTLLALLVIAGFGTLYVLVFDDSLQGQPSALAAEVAEKRGRILKLSQSLASARARLEDALESSSGQGPVVFRTGPREERGSAGGRTGGAGLPRGPRRTRGPGRVCRLA